MNQNGIDPVHEISDALTHYGVKGMKWGVRNDPIQTGKQNRTINKIINRNRYQGPVDKTNKIRNKAALSTEQKVSIGNNRLEFAFGSSKGEWSTIRSNDGKRSAQVKVERKNNKAGTPSWEITKAPSSSGGSTQTYHLYNDTTSDGYVDTIMAVLGCSEEEAKEMVKQADADWYDRFNSSDDVDEFYENLSKTKKHAADEANASKEYQDEVAANSRKNSFQNDVKNKTIKNLKKDKTWKEKIADGARKVGDTIEKVGKQAVSAAKNTIDSGKKALSKLFNVQTIRYDYTNKVVTAPSNASMKKVQKQIKKKTGNTAGWLYKNGWSR